VGGPDAGGRLVDDPGRAAVPGLADAAFGQALEVIVVGRESMGEPSPAFVLSSR
jgi:hypothetical protein